MPSEQPYHYDSLEKQRRQVRLFELLPGEKDEQLRGKLTTVDLDTGPDFDAVSYVWGNPTPRFTITVDDDKFLEIPENLRNALINLRRRDGSRTLWVDAICINQQDTQERGHQVRLMCAVYTTAQIVRVWLDDDVDPSSEPFQMARRLEIPGPPIDWDLYPVPSKPRQPRNLVSLESFDLYFWEPMYKILNNSYFWRVWTQQELFLARNLQFHLPRGILPLDILLRFQTVAVRSYMKNVDPALKYANRFLGKSVSELHTGFVTGRALTVNDANVSFRSEPSLLNLFLHSRLLEATEPRDRVYGMLGLAKDCAEDDILPDYNLPLSEVYSSVIKNHARNYRSLDFLCYYDQLPQDSDCAWKSLPT
ncbi:heterokaryon incompatibility protein-domain-containing protein [Biscogniauxia marginata]|nr:heterokaryon incompatibility protein-domain-containing protein [Biscogniauxia marginata]